MLHCTHHIIHIIHLILRCSAALVVKSKSPNTFPHKFHILTCAHVVAPWRWPQYYKQDWLAHVSERHMQYTVDIRDPSGGFLGHTVLSPTTYLHPVGPPIHLLLYVTHIILISHGWGGV